MKSYDKTMKYIICGKQDKKKTKERFTTLIDKHAHQINNQQIIS